MWLFAQKVVASSMWAQKQIDDSIEWGTQQVVQMGECKIKLQLRLTVDQIIII